jgi:polyphosphate glucokinase
MIKVSIHPASPQRARTLAIDVGGTGLKASVLDERGKMIADRVWVDTPYPCTPKVIVKALVALVKPLQAFDRVSVGFPGYVRHDKVITAPEFGNDIWHGFDLAKALKAQFGEPEDIPRMIVVLVSDVASYVTGRTIFVDGGMTDYPGFAHGG